MRAAKGSSGEFHTSVDVFACCLFCVLVYVSAECRVFLGPGNVNTSCWVFQSLVWGFVCPLNNVVCTFLPKGPLIKLK